MLTKTKLKIIKIIELRVIKAKEFIKFFKYMR